MLTVRERKAEQERIRKQSRERAKRAKAPVILDLPTGGIEDTAYDYLGVPRPELRVVLSQEYANIIKRTGDEKLINIAEKYKLPMTQEQRFLLESGDVYLEQYTKKDISLEEQDALFELGWSPLVSSNLKAVRVVEEDLQIMFHNDSIYQYPDRANMYYPFNEALSPGRLLWRTIRMQPNRRQLV